MYYYVLEMDLLLLKKSSHSLCSVPVYTFDCFISDARLDPEPTMLPFCGPLSRLTLTCATLAIYLSECKHIEVPSQFV